MKKWVSLSLGAYAFPTIGVMKAATRETISEGG